MKRVGELELCILLHLQAHHFKTYLFLTETSIAEKQKLGISRLHLSFRQEIGLICFHLETFAYSFTFFETKNNIIKICYTKWIAQLFILHLVVCFILLTECIQL